MMSALRRDSSWGGQAAWEGETASAKPVRSRSLGDGGALAMALAMGMALRGQFQEALRDRELAGVDAESP